jgi:hypothetical protein
MDHYLSVPPQLDSRAISTFERALPVGTGGRLHVFAGGTVAVSAHGVAHLRAVVDEARRRGAELTFEPPRSIDVLRRLEAAGFFADLEIAISPEPAALHGGRWSGVRLQRISSVTQAAEFATKAWLATRPFGRRLGYHILQVAEELASNAAIHSLDPAGVLGIMEVRRSVLELAIVDRGVGYRSSLESRFGLRLTDIDALLGAFGLSPGLPQSVGLPVLAELMAGRPGLELSVSSGGGSIRFANGRHSIDESRTAIGGSSAVLLRNTERE